MKIIIVIMLSVFGFFNNVFADENELKLLKTEAMFHEERIKRASLEYAISAERLKQIGKEIAEINKQKLSDQGKKDETKEGKK